MHVRKGDTVIVTAGNDRTAKLVGEVLEVDRERSRIIVKGANLRWKHIKPTQQSPKGERIQTECSIHSSNVMHYDSKLGKGVRRRPEGN